MRIVVILALAFVLLPLYKCQANSFMFYTILEHIEQYQEERIAEYMSNLILQYSNDYSVDPLLVTALFTQESGFNMNAVSCTGAIGVAQLMPDTANALGVNPYDIEQNIEGGIRYFAQQQVRFAYSGDWQFSYAIAAYNAGPGALEKYNGIPPYQETQNHVKAIYYIHSKLQDRYYELVQTNSNIDITKTSIENESQEVISIYKK